MSKGAGVEGRRCCASSLSVCSEDENKGYPLEDRGLLTGGGKQFLPPSCSISKEKTWHHRWKLTSKCLGSRSKAFAAGDTDADNAA